MSSVAEIESAIERLPVEEQEEIRRWLDGRTQNSTEETSKAKINWSQSAAVTRERPLAERIHSDVVLKAIAEGRE